MVDRIGESAAPAIAKPIGIKEIKEVKEVEVGQKPVTEPAKQSTPLKEEELQKFANQVNTFLQPTQTHVQFEYHEELKKYYVVLVDNKSKEVLKEIPEKKMLDMYASMREFIGLLFDQKV